VGTSVYASPDNLTLEQITSSRLQGDVQEIYRFLNIFVKLSNIFAKLAPGRTG
jgi:hypothetical protein